MLFDEEKASCEVAKTNNISSIHTSYLKFQVVYPIHNIETHLSRKF